MCQVIMRKHLRLVDNTIILIKHFNLYFLSICLFVYWTVRSYENGLSRYLNVFFPPHVAPIEGNHCNSPERWSIIYSYTTTMFREAECKHVPYGLKYKESTTTIPQKSVQTGGILFLRLQCSLFRSKNSFVILRTLCSGSPWQWSSLLLFHWRVL